MKKITILMTVALITLLLNSCNECPVCDLQNKCNVREVTITVFNPKLDKLNDSTLVPVPEYSIHSFLFPDADNSTGTLPNDTRYQQKDKIELADFTFSDGTQDLKAVLFGNYPVNERMNGDIMIIDADAATGTALIRVSGDIFKLPSTFMSEDATLFCTDYIPTNSNIINTSKILLVQYGKGLPIAQDEIFTANDVKIYDSKGIEVPVAIPITALNSLLSLVSGGAVNLSVKTGDVFLYRARNGRAFILSIANISKGTFTPNKKRVTILFTAI